MAAALYACESAGRRFDRFREEQVNHGADRTPTYRRTTTATP